MTTLKVWRASLANPIAAAVAGIMGKSSSTSSRVPRRLLDVDLESIAKDNAVQEDRNSIAEAVMGRISGDLRLYSDQGAKKMSAGKATDRVSLQPVRECLEGVRTR